MESNYEKKSTKVDLQAKEEGDVNQYTKLFPRPTSSSRQWSAFRNPRIVRVSRTFGGKDRHSKVCTIRGLRDRRIRLSVPTAIQLYELQDKLGLGQPSKVIDWLLDVTKNDIDNLPPLQVPLGFDQLHPQMFNPPHNHQSSSLAPLFDQNLHSLLAEKERFRLTDSREIVMGDSSRAKDKDVNYYQGGNFNSSSSSSVNINGLPFYNWDPSSLSLASYQYGGSSHGQGLPLYTSSNPSFASQYFFPPPPPPPPHHPPTNMTSLFPTYAHESRSSNDLQLLSSGSLSHHRFLPRSDVLNENPEYHHGPGKDIG